MSTTTLPDPDALATLYKGVSEPIRVRILALLAHGELCVCHLHAELDAPQPTLVDRYSERREQAAKHPPSGGRPQDRLAKGGL